MSPADAIPSMAVTVNIYVGAKLTEKLGFCICEICPAGIYNY